MSRHARPIFSVVLILIMAACSTRDSDTIAMPAEFSEARVEVRNNNWSSMRVYVMRGTTRFRLGTVTSMNTEVFRLPRSFAGASGDIRLIADPIGSRETHITQSVNLGPGRLLSFQIENHLAISTVSVR